MSYPRLLPELLRLLDPLEVDAFLDELLPLLLLVELVLVPAERLLLLELFTRLLELLFLLRPLELLLVPLERLLLLELPTRPLLLELLLPVELFLFTRPLLLLLPLLLPVCPVDEPPFSTLGRLSFEPLLFGAAVLPLL